MLFDLVILALVLVFVALGAWRGALASFLALLSLVAAYAAAIVAATRFGSGLAHQFGLPPVAGPPFAGCIGFVGTFVVFAVLGFFAKRWDRERLGGDSRGAADRLFGGVFGGLRGAVIALLVAVLGSFLDAARELDPEGALAMVPSAQQSLTAGVTEKIVEGAVESALGDEPGAQLVGRIAARPGRIHAVQKLIDDPRLQVVQEDAFFWTLVQNGASERALNRGSFYRIAHDPDMRSQLADLGLVSQDAAGDSERFREELRGVLDEVGPRIKGLRDDPEIQRLAHDPEILGMLESGNTFGLLTNPDILALASRLSGGTGPQEADGA